MHDVLVVGAGPAGSTAALTLAREGYDVAIVERSAIGRNKVCGEYLSAGAVAELQSLGVGERLRAVAHPIEGTRLNACGVRAELRFNGESWALARTVLDAALVRAAVDAGATMVRGNLEEIDRTDGIAATVRDEAGDRGELRARFAIGADGAHSFVARACGIALRPGKARFALGGHFARESFDARYVEMCVDGGAYCGINPLGGGRLNVMLVVPEPSLRAAREDVDGFFATQLNALSGLHFDARDLLGKRAACGPLAFAATGACVPGVLLAGDAAGFVDPFIGQGVYLALRGGKRAAATIASALTRRTNERSAWRAYDLQTRRELAARKRLARLIQALLASGRLTAYLAKRIAKRPERAQPLLDAIAGIAPVEQALAPRRLVQLFS